MAIDSERLIEVRGKVATVKGEKLGPTQYQFVADCEGHLGIVSVYSGAHPEKGMDAEYFQQSIDKARQMAAEKAVLHAEHAELEVKID